MRSVYRLLFLPILGLLLSACSLLHPYRLPTPPVSPELKAQRKAAERARKQSAHTARQSKQRADASADAAPTGPAPAADAAPKEPPRNARLKYDRKTGLMKKPKLMRRRMHKQPGKPFKPFAALRNLFHRKPKPHGKAHSSAPAPAP